MPRRPPHGSAPPPRKRFGQHFLADQHALDRIADAVAVDARPGDQVVEIGPGRGALTDALVRRGLRVLAVEIDRDLVRYLRERYPPGGPVTVVEGDVLEFDLAAHAGPDYRLVGNLPYYITTPILFRALQPPLPRSAVFLVQREVADRMAATPGSRAYGALTVNLLAVATVELIGRVKAGAFVPPPKVDSAIVRLVPRETPVIGAGREAPLRDFVIAMFGQRRKQASRALRQVTKADAVQVKQWLDAAGVDPVRRPETLSPEEFAALFEQIHSSR
ncbi:MAG: 16S rRNA (adenine(1518)-N(6)/adenine(1519)-N(6))-dimethyltransferase RsmA [Gemmatimonadaceae bacterium]